MIFTVFSILIATSANTGTAPVLGHSAFVGVHGGVINYIVKKVFKDDVAKKAFEAKKTVDASLSSPEVRPTAVNGLFGAHAGFTKFLNKKTGVGASVEGHKAFGGTLKISGVDTKKAATFGANFLTHLRFALSPQTFFGFDAGLGVQAFRSPIETVHAFSPLVGLAVGHFVCQHVAAKIDLRYAWPMKQGDDAGISSKPSSASGVLGLSYYFS